MVGNHLISWMIGREDPREARNRSHRVALREARLASEERGPAAQPFQGPHRISLATAAGPGVELACCPA